MSINSIPSTILINGPYPEPAKRSEIGENAEVDGTSAVGYKITNFPNGCIKNFESVLKNNPNFNIDTPTPGGGWTCMAMAIKMNWLPLIHAILDRDPTIAGKAWGVYKPDSYIGEAAFYGRNMVQAFLDRGANINTLSSDGSTPLFNAAKSDTLVEHETTKFLLLRGAVLYQSPREEILSSLDDDYRIKTMKEGVSAQPRIIQKAIDEIQHEFQSAHKPLIDLRKAQKSSLDPAGLPDELAAEIMSFLPETQMRYQFLTNNGYLNGPAAMEEAPL